MTRGWLLKRCALALAIAAGCYILFGLIGYNCLLFGTFGLPCPTCGMSRAWLAALRLDLAAAFRWHPLFWAVPPLALIFLFSPPQSKWPVRAAAGTLALALLVWLVRMLLWFPHTAPMLFDPNATIPRILHRVFHFF